MGKELFERVSNRRMKMSDYQPELGQMLFGQPPQQFECPEILEAALAFIRNDLSRVMWNLRQKDEPCPFGNSAASWRCEVFCVASYSWGDEGQPWNFKHYPTSIEVSWYKYLGRGMSVNREVTPDEVSGLLRSCMSALKAVDARTMAWDEPGLYPEGPLPPPPEG